MVQKGILCLFFFLLLGASQAQDLIRGAGASFPAPLYRSWFKKYQQSYLQNQFSYQATGSGRGIEKLVNQEVDFGASDIPMTDAQLKKSKYKIIHIPSVVGAIAIIYNHPEIPDGLRITGPVLREIFQAKIRVWNDPKIQTLNPLIKLPADLITPVVRKDNSGTSKIIRQYFRRYGFGKSPWRATFIRANGSRGVSEKIRKIPQTIGYLNLNFAKTDGHKIMALKNSFNEFISPSPENISLAASTVRGSRVRVSLLDKQIKGAYPLTSFSFILLPVIQTQAQKITRDFIKWALSYGQRMTGKLHYAPLPKKLAKTLVQRL